MQPMSESYSSVNRRPMDIEDYFDIVRRHKAWILGPTFAALVLSTVVAFLWPDTYVSRGVIRVVPPQVPESFVPTNINSQMSQRINSMYQTISSRGNLTNIINLYNLYPKQRERKPMEDVVEDMRRAIRIGNVVPVSAGQRNEISAFQISFSYENRIIAQKVTADLVSRFMTENTRERTTQSVLTTQFLKDQLDSAKKDLDAIEEKLTDFRISANGRLPDQISQQGSQMNMLENRISNLNMALGRISQEKMLLESDLRSLKNQRAALTPGSESILQRKRNARLAAVENRILQLESNLATLRQHYKDSYPDVQRIQAQLNTAESMRDRILQAEGEEEGSETAAPAIAIDPMYEREARRLDLAIDRLEAQLKVKDSEAANYQKEIGKTEKGIQVVQGRIESTPVSQQQYTDIVRDREIAKMRYDEMNRKRSQSQVAEDLERRQQGETLELLDPASLPQSPTEPKRPFIIGAGTGLGLAIGLFLAGAREAKDTSLKNLKDVRAYTQLTILGSVPLLENDLVVKRRKRLGFMAWATACLFGIIIMAGSVIYYYNTKV
jgi:polysaccharide chain length determinant protein (PEP-CTERM system associated)